MADVTAEIETMEHRFMRSWVQRDVKALKGMTARRFFLLVGSKPAVILDTASWLAASTTRFQCNGYRFGDIYVRRVGGMAMFATQLEMKSLLDGEDWSGAFWLTDLWSKGRVRRRWQLVERVLSRVDDGKKVPAAFKSMQLWK